MFIFPKYIRGIESLDHKVKYVQIYKVLPNCFSKRIYHFCIPLTMHWSFSCSISLSTFSIVSLYYVSYFSGYVLVSHCGCKLLGNVSMKELYFQIAFSYWQQGFLGGSDGKASARNSEDLGSIPGSGRSPGEGNGNPLQYSCLENSMD